MSTRWLTLFALMALALATPALADNGKAKAKHVNHRFDDDDRKGGRDHDRDDDRWERRDGYEYRVFRDRDDRPPGWSRGKKTGWGNCGLPPGQAKKYGCRTYTYRGRQHYYYRDERGNLFVRRPVIVVR
ncbi:MAG TPA: hypothetical protein VMS96_14730 [Terriglobales bacterium]|nr:hypothetical protein [Terriglobales bacterium]